MTFRLILMRHAKSSWDSPGLDDHARPLNDRGRRSAAALGDWLRAKGYLPDQVLCSSAVRTQETLDGLRLDAAAVDHLSALYHAGPDAMLHVLNGATGLSVLMLGHNPGIAAFAHLLLHARPRHARFDDYPTGATLVADFDAPGWDSVDWRTGRTADFTVPADLGIGKGAP